MLLSGFVIGEYHYSYSKSTRWIRFLRGSEGVLAQFHAITKYDKEWQLVSNLMGDSIRVNRNSKSDRTKAIQARKEGKSFKLMPGCNFDDLEIYQQQDILDHLYPKGKWKMKIENHVGNHPRFEEPFRMTFYDSS